MTPTPTPTVFFNQPTGATPTEETQSLTAPKVIPPTWTPALTATTSSSEGETIVFDSPPANIYMSFADGPGLYRLEIFAPSGQHLRNLFEKKIVAQEDAWAEWDGKKLSRYHATVKVAYRQKLKSPGR